MIATRSGRCFVRLSTLILPTTLVCGCSAWRATDVSRVETAVAAYQREQAASLRPAADGAQPPFAPGPAERFAGAALASVAADFSPADFAQPYLTLAVMPASQDAQSRPAKGGAASGVAPDGYWKDGLFRQMGSEFKHFALRDFWLGYKESFWNVPNALLIGGAWGASIAIRESGVDDTVARQIHHHRQLGDADETLQILGNPATHFAAAGAFWIGTTLMQDAKNHEVAKTLVEALCVNGLTTTILKVSTNTSSPDGEGQAWPSGHTSSIFTVAAVMNEYYGPLVGVPSFALAGLAGYQRLDSRVHDLSDVVFGAVLGYVVGTSIAREHKGEALEFFGMTPVPYTDPQTGAVGFALMKQY